MIRPPGNTKPEFCSAARTRSRASRTALSASPTTVNAGRPLERMSASTHTRRLVTPSTANVLTRAITAQNACSTWSSRTKPVVAVDEHADRVEAQLLVPGPVGRLAQPVGGDPPHLRLLGAVQAVERLTRAEPPRLDLAEDERAAVGEHQVELPEAGVVVLGEHGEPEPREVLRGEPLPEPAEVLAVRGLHARGR